MESSQAPPSASPPGAVVGLWLCHLRPPQPAGERLLAPDERQRARRFADGGARVLFVLGRSLLRAALAGYLGCASQELRLDQRCSRCGAPHGKPRLVDPPATWLSTCRTRAG